MPTTYTHWLFGEKCISTLPEKFQKMVLLYRHEFDYGVQGPDLFFYYDCIHPNEINRYGYGAHDTPFRDLMEGFRDNLNKAKNKEGSLSYLIGFLCHFTLDSYCHSYVEIKEKKTGPSHAKIESQFDRYLMEKNGLNPIKVNRDESLCPDKDCIEHIADIYLQFPKKIVGKSMKDQKLILKLIKDDYKLKRKLLISLFTKMKLEGYIDLMISDKNEEICKDSNLRLEKLMDKALEHFPELFSNLMDYLESGVKLPPYFKNHFDPKPGWEEIPVLTYEEELSYTVKKQD